MHRMPGLEGGGGAGRSAGGESPRRPDPAKAARALQLLSFALAGALILAAAARIAVRGFVAAGPPIDDMTCVCAAFALLLCVLVPLLGRIPARAVLAAFTSVSAVGVAFLVCEACSLGLPSRVRLLIWGPAPPSRVVPPIWEFSPVYGVDHVPGSRGRHSSADYDVTYTIGGDRCRVTPDPPHPAGLVLVVGCSIAFGQGVEDDEGFPYLLGAEHWTRHKVRNRSVMGWGTAQAYCAVAEALEGARAPSLVLYAMLPGRCAVERNYLRRSWFEKAQIRENPREDWRGLPHFDVRNGRPVFMGLAWMENAVDDAAPGLARKETEVTCALLEGMSRACRARAAPFAVVALPLRDTHGLDPEVGRALRAANVPVLDLSHMPVESFARDPHLSARDHEGIARAIADWPPSRAVDAR